MSSTNPTTIFFLRHGQTVNTVDGNFRYNGHLDVEVTAESLAQMAAIAEQLADYPVSQVFSSDLKRSITGAAIIAKRLGCPHTIAPEFREIKMGLWEGLTYDEVMVKYPQDLQRKFADFINYRVPGGETIPEVENRLFGKLNELITTYRGQHLVIVAHGGINMLCICHALGIPATEIFHFKQDFCCINQIEYSDNFARICLLNSPCLKTKSFTS